MIVVYYESINREFKRRHIYECRCGERLKLNLRDLLDERFVSVMGECVIVKVTYSIGVP